MAPDPVDRRPVSSPGGGGTGNREYSNVSFAIIQIKGFRYVMSDSSNYVKMIVHHFTVISVKRLQEA